MISVPNLSEFWEPQLKDLEQGEVLALVDPNIYALQPWRYGGRGEKISIEGKLEAMEDIDITPLSPSNGVTIALGGGETNDVSVIADLSVCSTDPSGEDRENVCSSISSSSSEVSL